MENFGLPGFVPVPVLENFGLPGFVPVPGNLLSFVPYIKCSQLESKVQEMERVLKVINEGKKKPTDSEELIDIDPEVEEIDTLSKGDDDVPEKDDEEGKKSVKVRRKLKKQKQKEKKRMNMINFRGWEM